MKTERIQAEKLLAAIGEINEEAIRCAREQRGARPRKWAKPAFLAACLCIALIAIFTVSDMSESAPAGEKTADTGAGNSALDGNPDGYAPVPGGLIIGDAEVSEQDPMEQASMEPASTERPQNVERDSSPVYYSSLLLPEGDLNTDTLALSAGAMMDVKEFDESMLSECCMIIEGMVVNLYVKNYAYDVYSDKFEKNGILHGRTCTVVYEVAIDKIWYGGDIGRETILVEDTSYFTEPILAVKRGMRYVLPLYEYGDSIWTGAHEYAGGDIARDSRYSTIYPYHPQIEVTEDGSYLIPRDWKTLTAQNARDVIMDVPEKESEYQDKMCLVDGDTFAEQMAVLTAGIR